MPETEHNLRDAGKLEEFIIEFLGERLATLGENEGGLYNYYKTFWDMKIGYAYYDVAIAEFLKPKRGQIARVIDVGAGIGQLSALLAASGFEAFAIERNGGRASAAQDLFARIATADRHFAGRLHAIKDGFPCGAVKAADKEAIVIFTNVIVGDATAVEPMLVGGLGGFGGVVMDLMRFAQARSSAAQWQSLSETVMAEGFGAPQDVFSPAFGDPPTPRCRVVYFPALARNRGRRKLHPPRGAASAR